MQVEQLKPDLLIQGDSLSEPIKLIKFSQLGNAVKIIGTGIHTRKNHNLLFSLEQLQALEISPETMPYNGDAARFRLGIEALRLSLAYEYDPYFTLSISKIDPLPHQLEAVYDYFLKLPRVRFLLADDPGAGKTIMAGLLIKELKIRGLIRRTLIISPANLTFQWQREMQEKFRENFTVMNGDRLRTVYGTNPWQENQQIVTSIAWVSRIEEANKSLLQSHWDLIIVDEAHKMSATKAEKKTLAYSLGEKLSTLTDHYLLMTATPHKGEPENFRLFLALLDKDVYAHVESIHTAIAQNEAPFYLRRVKESLVSFPHPKTGVVKNLFTKRIVKTITFHLNHAEQDFYEALSRYVERQAEKVKGDDSAKGRALGFTLALLQRRFASSVYALRRTLERMVKRREDILKSPQKYREAQIAKKLPDDFSDLPDDEQEKILAEIESILVSIDPYELKQEIRELTRLIEQAQQLEEHEIESKLAKLKTVIKENQVFQDQAIKLLIFTEHKDTLEYLVKKLTKDWDLTVTQIHGGMKVGGLNMPGSRLQAEHAFKNDCQLLVATEAAGEGINLQFCWFMINYDIPWNPIRLEQRMGRIHRYGQPKDCLIINFVSEETREGRVLGRLLERIESIEKDLDPQRTGKVFNVLGDIFPANQLERWLRDMYINNMSEAEVTERIVETVDSKRFEEITQSALEGLAKKDLNLASLFNRTKEAKAKRSKPEFIEDFFVQSAQIVGLPITVLKSKSNQYRLGKIPRGLLAIGEQLTNQFGALGREYKHIAFDKDLLKKNPALEWVTLGHPLFETVRQAIWNAVQTDLQHGAMFFDLQCEQPLNLHIFKAAIIDGRGHILHKRLFVVEVLMDGRLQIQPPTRLSDLIPVTTHIPIPKADLVKAAESIELFLLENALQAFLEEVKTERHQELATIAKHLNISYTEITNKLQCQWADLDEIKQSGKREAGLAGRLKQVEDRLDEKNARWEQRKHELAQEQNCFLSDIECIGRAWVLPHPERQTPELAPLVRDQAIEHIAIQTVIAYEQKRGFQVESVEKDNCGFDLISRPLSYEDVEQVAPIRFIEVKGRAKKGMIVLTPNEYYTAQRLGDDYWLYVVLHCATKPELQIFQNPAALNWDRVIKVEHYRRNF